MRQRKLHKQTRELWCQDLISEFWKKQAFGCFVIAVWLGDSDLNGPTIDAGRPAGEIKNKSTKDKINFRIDGITIIEGLLSLQHNRGIRG